MALPSQTQRSIYELPEDAVTKIMVLLGTKSACDVMRCKIISKTFKAAYETDAVYMTMEVDSLTSGLYWGYDSRHIAVQRCRASRNPNIIFFDGMNRYFYLHDDSGLQILEEASLAGNKDAIFAMGMIMMAEGQAMKPQALQMLNAAYPCSSTRTPVILETMRKVEFSLARFGKREVAFHGCLLTCTQHPPGGRDRGFILRAPWLFGCDVCLWEAYFIRFAWMFGMLEYGDMFRL